MKVLEFPWTGAQEKSLWAHHVRTQFKLFSGQDFFLSASLRGDLGLPVNQPLNYTHQPVYPSSVLLTRMLSTLYSELILILADMPKADTVWERGVLGN